MVPVVSDNISSFTVLLRGVSNNWEPDSSRNIVRKKVRTFPFQNHLQHHVSKECPIFLQLYFACTDIHNI